MLDLMDEEATWGFDYANQYAIDLLIFMIAFAFSVITPFVTPAALFYFLAAYIGGKHELTHVWRPHYQLGGDFWPILFDRLVVGVIVSHILLIGYFSLKEGFGQAALGCLLPVISLRFWFYVNRTILPAAKFLPFNPKHRWYNSLNTSASASTSASSPFGGSFSPAHPPSTFSSPVSSSWLNLRWSSFPSLQGSQQDIYGYPRQNKVRRRRPPSKKKTGEDGSMPNSTKDEDEDDDERTSVKTSWKNLWREEERRDLAEAVGLPYPTPAYAHPALLGLTESDSPLLLAEGR